MANISTDISNELDRTQNLYDHIEEDLKEFAQGATDFQIEVFIANGEGPINRFPVHAYRHLLAQVRPLISEMRRVLIDKERTTRKITRLTEKQPEDWDLDVMDLQYRLKDMDIDLKGKWSTYQTYERLLTHLRDKYGPFTHEDLQEQEAEYWEYRLSKQMFDSKQGAVSALGSGNLNSLRMAFQGSVLPDSPHRVTPFDPDEEHMVDIITRKVGLLGESDAK